MKNWAFIIMTFAWLVSQYILFIQKETIINYKAVVEDSKEVVLIYKNTLDKTASTLLECSDATDTAKEMMVYMYVEGANDYMKCKDMTIPDSNACARIRKSIEKLGEYNG